MGHMTDATTAKLSSMHFHGWQLGLKTGMYYLRTKAATDAIKFTVDVETQRRASAVGGPAAGAGQVEQQAIEKLKAGEPKYACVGCSSEVPKHGCDALQLEDLTLLRSQSQALQLCSY